MQIHGPNQIHGPQSIGGPHRPQTSAQPPQSPGSAMPADQLDISREADLVSRAHDLPDVRHELVARIRAEIAAGTYETEEKMQMAVGALLDELGG